MCQNGICKGAILSWKYQMVSLLFKISLQLAINIAVRGGEGVILSNLIEISIFSPFPLNTMSLLFHSRSELVKDMKSLPFSLSIDGSSDEGLIKMNPLLVQIFDPTKGSISLQLLDMNVHLQRINKSRIVCDD